MNFVLERDTTSNSNFSFFFFFHLGKAKYFPLLYLWKLLDHVHFFYLNKEAKPLHRIFLYRQSSVSVSIKRLK